MLKEFYETFCNEVKHICQKSLKQVKEKGQLSISERQAIIKLIEKKIEKKGKFGKQYHYLMLIQKLYQNLSPQSQKKFFRK